MNTLRLTPVALLLLCGTIAFAQSDEDLLRKHREEEIARFLAAGDQPFSLRTLVNGQRAPEVRREHPLIVRLEIIPQADRRSSLGVRQGTWMDLLRLECTDAEGRPVAAAFRAVAPAAAKAEVRTEGLTATWVLQEEDAARLPPGTYMLTAILDSRKAGLAGTWRGLARSSVPLKITAAPGNGPADQSAALEHVRVEADLLTGNGSRALVRADALIAAHPEDYEALALRGKVLKALNRHEEAQQAFHRSATLLAQKHPERTQEAAIMTRLARSDPTPKPAATPKTPGRTAPPSPTPASAPAKVAGTPPVAGAMPVANLLQLPLRGWTAESSPANATFTTPAGWRASDEKETRMLVPPDLPAGATAAMILPPSEASAANFDVWFAAQWKAITDGYVVEARGQVARRRTAAGLLALSTTGRLKAPDGGTAYVFFFAARAGAGPRTQRGAFVTNVRELMDRHLETARGVMESVSLP